RPVGAAGDGGAVAGVPDLDPGQDQQAAPHHELLSTEPRIIQSQPARHQRDAQIAMILSDLILKNFWLKFFSVALATVIWLGIHFGIHNEISVSQLNLSNLLAQEYIRVPVTIMSAPNDTRTFRISPPDVVVIAVGEKTALRRAAE